MYESEIDGFSETNLHQVQENFAIF